MPDLTNQEETATGHELKTVKPPNRRDGSRDWQKGVKVVSDYRKKEAGYGKDSGEKNF